MAKEAEIRLRKQNTFWNMVYSLINAAQSALLLSVVNRICFEEKAGVFSYAFSVSVLTTHSANSCSWAGSVYGGSVSGNRAS